MKTFHEILYTKKTLDQTDRFNEKYNYDAKTLFESVEEYAEQFKQKWIDVTDRLPGKGKIVPVKLSRNGIVDVVMGWINSDGLWVCLNREHPFQAEIIAWTHLPEE